ncbi:MAG TPA: histidine--tRNA ligase [Mycobacteriales bacterium]|nr:histidine--tRNA ligase [Mycobacteriales bacterium]
MAKTVALSGFPEWLPEQRLVELEVLDTLRSVFELYGFSSVETRATEPLDALVHSGETSKEIYVLRRLHAESAGDDSGLGLHFDLTVPLARYVVEHAGKLSFPFRRYQIQKAWRGERPQDGRFREFTQADIDIIGRDSLAFHHEVELPLVVADAFRRLPLPPWRISVNNRRVIEGFSLGLGVAAESVPAVMRTVDKLDKVGDKAVHDLLVRDGLTDAQAASCLELASISAADSSFVADVRRLGVQHDLLDQGLDELARVIDAAAEHAPGLLVADLKIARGLDYYTGTVYETQLLGHEDLGSICSGGRYDALATDGTTMYPGVGISVGVTRLLSRLLGRGLVSASRSVPTCVLVALADEAARPAADRIAAALRSRRIATEVSPEAAKYGKQIRYADRRGIPFVWFPASESTSHEVKDIRSGEQVQADPSSWSPPAADLRPTIRAVPEFALKEIAP